MPRRSTPAAPDAARDGPFAAGAVEVRLARDEAERKRFWAGRKGAFPAMGRLAPDYYCIDGTIPRRALPKVLTEITRLAEENGVGAGQVIHPTRMAVTGRTFGPGLFELMEVIGRDRVLKRLERGATLSC